MLHYSQEFCHNAGTQCSCGSCEFCDLLAACADSPEDLCPGVLVHISPPSPDPC